MEINCTYCLKSVQPKYKFENLKFKYKIKKKKKAHGIKDSSTPKTLDSAFNNHFIKSIV